MIANQRTLAIGILTFGILLSLFLVWDVLAASSADIKFPVVELNNCKSEADCRAFCDKPENAKSCLSFARKYNLLSESELKKAEKLAEVKNGPGGCNSQKSCESFCNDINNIDECLSFAEKNELMDQGQLEEAKKVQGAIKRGAKLPGGCSDKNSCDSYCSNPDNADGCLAFAEDAGIISQEELVEARRILPLMKRGEAPGACKSKGACEAYCEDESHAEECISFAEKAGFISKEEADIVKKTGGRGPGGCRGRACKSFCEDPANQEVCFEFAKENGLIKEEDLQRMQQGSDLIRRDLGKAPPEIKECIEAVLGPGGLDKLESGKPFGGRDIGEKMKSCYEKFIPQGFGQFKEGGEFAGPGGCKSFEECSSYCQTNQEDESCKKFVPPGMRGGRSDGGFSGESQGDEQIRGELFEKERQLHLESIQKEDPKIVACMREKMGPELFERRQQGRLQDRDEGLRVEEIIRSCRGGFLTRWQQIIREASPEDRKCLDEKLGRNTVERILNGEEVANSGWAIESECRFLQSSGSGDSEGRDLPQSGSTSGGFTPPSGVGGYPSSEDLQKYQQQYEEQFKQFQDQAPSGYQPQIPPEYQQYLPQ